MKFDLIDISERLLTAEEELAQKLMAMLPLEKELTSRKASLLISNQGLASQPLREAEVTKTIMNEEIYDKYHTALLEVKLAYSRRDVLMQISRNIISYKFGEER